MHIHILHTLNRANQPIIQLTTIMWENNTVCVRSRSSQEPSLRREEYSRLGETANKGVGRFREISLEWDCASLKTQFFAWASVRAKLLDELLLLSSRWDELAWAKITVLPHYSTTTKPEIHLNNKQCIFFPLWTSHNHQKCKTEPKIGNIDLKYETLASLTLKKC